MKTTQIIKHVSLISSVVLLLTGFFQIQAQELRFIMCGGEVREADQIVIDDFRASNPGVTVNMEAVPWGT